MRIRKAYAYRKNQYVAYLKIRCIFAAKIITTGLCTYSIKLDDNLVDQVRPSFSDDIALQRWLEEQLEYVLRQFYTKERQETLRKAREAIEAMRQQSELNGNSELTLNEINEEIRLSREARKTAV